MPSPHGKTRVEIPASLYDALDQLAEIDNVPTSSLIADWLCHELSRRRALPGNPAAGLQLAADRDFRAYPRRRRPGTAKAPRDTTVSNATAEDSATSAKHATAPIDTTVSRAIVQAAPIAPASAPPEKKPAPGPLPSRLSRRERKQQHRDRRY